MISCDECRSTDISSCPKIGLSYEINRRFNFAMRCLGQGASGAKNFCGLMDLFPPVTQKSYNEKNIHIAFKVVTELSMRDAVQEEQLKMSLEQEVKNTTDLATLYHCFWRRVLAKPRVFFFVWGV